MVSEEDAQQVAEAWIAAWNRHDLDTILDLYANDVVSVSPLVVSRLGIPDGTVRGKEQLRDYFSRGLQPGSQLHFTLQRVLIGVDGIAIYYTRHDGSHSVDIMTLDSAGKIQTARVYHG
ncbi:MAG TPA: nuclear transport factor 2 family protein [Thermomicrobiales bacterium]|nr:nuclear transport factor 2 family protein [Thermomicrobiales bacterium]